MAKPTTTPRNMETTADESQQQSPVVEQVEMSEPDPGPKQFPEIIGDGVAACMRDRTVHMQIEREMDAWVNHLSPNKSVRGNQLRVAREQIETAKLALEALYLRFRNIAVTAKN